MIARFAIGRDLVADQLELLNMLFEIGYPLVSVYERPRKSYPDRW